MFVVSFRKYDLFNHTIQKRAEVFKVHMLKSNSIVLLIFIEDIVFLPGSHIQMDIIEV